MTKTESKRLIEFLMKHENNVVNIDLVLYPDKYTTDLWLTTCKSRFRYGSDFLKYLADHEGFLQNCCQSIKVEAYSARPLNYLESF